MNTKKIMKVCLASALAVSMVSTNVAPVVAADTVASATDKEATKIIGVNYEYTDENGEKVYSVGSVEVPADASNVNTSLLKDIPEGYETVIKGDIAIGGGDTEYPDGWIFVELQKKTTKTIGVNYQYTDENGETVYKEGSVEVPADASNVNTSLLKDIPEGYETVIKGDIAIAGGDAEYPDGWIFVELKATTKQIGINYYCPEEERQIAEEFITVEADAVNVNTSMFMAIPDGYELVWSGDLQINDGWVYAEVRRSSKENGIAIDVVFKDGDDVVGEGTYVVDEDNDNIFNFSELEKYIPDGYELNEFGDQFVNWESPLEVSVKKIHKESRIHVQFTYNGNVMRDICWWVDPDGDGIFNYSELKKIVPHGYKMQLGGDVFVDTNTTYVIPLEKIKKESDIYVAFMYKGKILETGRYAVDPDGDGIFNWSELSKYVPDGYKMLRWGNESVDAGPFVVQLAKNNNYVPGTPGIDGKKNGWYKVGDSDWSYYIDNKKVVSDWISVEEADPYNNNKVGKVWYHMNAEGLMDRGWIIDESGWKVYLLDSNGRMMHSQWVNAPASEELNRPAGLYKLTDDGAVQMNGWAESVTPGIYWFCNAGTGLFEVDNPASWGSEKLF